MFITNDEVFQRASEERLLSKFLKNRHHSWIGHTVGHKEFAVNIIEGAIFGKKNAVGRPRLQYLKQDSRNTTADSYRAMKRMACKQFQMESCQPIKRLRDKKKKIFVLKMALYRRNMTLFCV